MADAEKQRQRQPLAGGVLGDGQDAHGGDRGHGEGEFFNVVRGDLEQAIAQIKESIRPTTCVMNKMSRGTNHSQVKKVR